MTALHCFYLAADAGCLVVRGLTAARVNGDKVVAAHNRIVEHEFKMAVLHLQHARLGHADESLLLHAPFQPPVRR